MYFSGISFSDCVKMLYFVLYCSSPGTRSLGFLFVLFRPECLSQTKVCMGQGALILFDNKLYNNLLLSNHKSSSVLQLLYLFRFVYSFFFSSKRTASSSRLLSQLLADCPLFSVSLQVSFLLISCDLYLSIYGRLFFL